MLSMILQLGGWASLIIGSKEAAVGHPVIAESKTGKFDFWYQ